MLFAWLIAGPMTRRLDALAAQVRMARGNPGARLTAHAGSADEIAELGTAFNDLLDAAEKREQQNRLLALAVDQANEAVLLADTEGRLTRWNRGAEQMFGWSAAEALGRTVRELHAPMISEASCTPTASAGVPTRPSSSRRGGSTSRAVSSTSR